MRSLLFAALILIVPTVGLAQHRDGGSVVPGPTVKSTKVVEDERVRLALESKDYGYEVVKPSQIYRVNFKAPKGRHQKVLIASFNEKVTTDDINSPFVRRIWSTAYSGAKLPSAEILAKLMLDSNRKRVGSWEILKEANGNYTVLFDVKVDANAPPETVAWIIAVTSGIVDAAEQDFEAASIKEHASDSDFKPTIDQY